MIQHNERLDDLKYKKCRPYDQVKQCDNSKYIKQTTSLSNFWTGACQQRDISGSIVQTFSTRLEVELLQMGTLLDCVCHCLVQKVLGEMRHLLAVLVLVAVLVVAVVDAARVLAGYESLLE